MRIVLCGLAVYMAALVNQSFAQQPAAPGNAQQPAVRGAAQQPPRDQRATQPFGAAARPGAPGQANQSDQEIAAVKLAMCRNEVELAKFASQKAESDKVKEFAAKLVKDHSEECSKLEQRAGAAGQAAGRDVRTGATGVPAVERDPAGTPGTVETRPGAAAPGTQPGTRPGAVAGANPGAQRGVGQDLNWVSIHQQIADQCLESAKQELSEKQGAEFDKCYIGLTLASHQHAIDSGEVLQNHVSSEFRGDIENGVKVAKSHLEEAKDIMKSLADKSRD